MCLIAFKESHNGVFTNRQFKYMIARNPDGFGVMYREKGRVKVIKSLGSNSEKFQIFAKIRHKDFWAMHARIRTHGAIDETNCHPYKILSKDEGDAIDLYLMHNGTIAKAPTTDSTKSDTWHYVEHVLKPLVKADIKLL
jgi:predicted glutamine amidotransferase